MAAAMGGVFSSAEVTIVAFCGQRGATGVSGALLACLAFGSCVAGFVYGSRHRNRPVLQRLVRQSLLFAVLPLLFLLAVNVPVLAVLAFVVGTGIAPTLITAFGSIEQLVPGPALTEGISWFSTGLSVGFGLSAAFVGHLADSHGARFAFSVTITCGILVGALALLLARRLPALAEASQPAVVGAE
jgi:MFS family permease